MTTTLPAMLRDRCRTLPEKTAILVPKGKEYVSINGRQLEEKARAYAAVVKELGLSRGDRLALQSENCVEWSLLDWGCHSIGVILVPIYPTLPNDQTQYIVKDCEAKVVVSSTSEQQAKVADMDVQRKLLSELVARAEEISMPVEEWEAEVDKAQAEDLATIIYTSGTTGNPKGVMLPHRAFLTVCKHATDEIGFREGDMFLTFLPMSHVYERVVGQALPLYCGAVIAFSKGLASLAQEMVTIKPTIMLCVPRFLEATMDKILDGVKKQKPLNQKLFHWALDQGSKKADGKFAPFAGLLDKLVGAKIREKTGGNIRFFVSGGAALPPHVARFYMAFGLTILQGYGLTETAGGSVVNRPGPNNKYWTVGEPLGVEVKIADDGEILIKGPGVMLGYYHLPEETEQAIDKDGYFHTGDIGEWEGKNLKITDRKKDLLILANGKNIAPQMIENRLKESTLISEVVLFGDGNEYVYGLVIPNFERVRAQLETTDEDAALVAREDVKALIKAEVDRVNKTLADYEKVKKHALLAATFSVDSGELTPSLKVKRRVVKEKYASALSGLTR